MIFTKSKKQIMKNNSKPIKHFLIKHKSGSKENQHETFAFDKHEELTFGREESNDVQFDPDKDSMVSRNHCKITKGSKPLEFFVEDLKSLNGLFVNGEKVEDRKQISVGDTIMLGEKGPEIEFDLDPRPAGAAKTKMMSTVSGKPTVEMNTAEENEEDNSEPGSSKKETIGKQTFERAISSERKRSSRTLVAAAVALVIVMAALGFTFKDQFVSTVTEVVVEPGETVIVDERFNAEQIIRDNEGAVVFIEVGYKLIHATTGDDVYHEYMNIEDPETGESRLVALYLENERGEIEPALGLSRYVETGEPIAVSGATGSGFVVDDAGFILTNRHVVAMWHTSYSFPQEAYNGRMVRYIDGEWQLAEVVPTPPQNWVPANSEMLGRRPLSGKVLEGQNIYLDVTFANNDLRTPANIVRVSSTHDVAMIKVDLPGGLTHVSMRDASPNIAPGQRILIMGYPGMAPDVIVGRASADLFNRRSQVFTVPSPTSTEGSIGRVITANNRSQDDFIEGYFSTIGEYYQISGSSPGAGNSGGPVFDKDGNVIGLFTMGPSTLNMSYAVPIKFGMNLMNPSSRTVMN